MAPIVDAVEMIRRSEQNFSLVQEQLEAIRSSALTAMEVARRDDLPSLVQRHLQDLEQAQLKAETFAEDQRLRFDLARTSIEQMVETLRGPTDLLAEYVTRDELWQERQKAEVERIVERLRGGFDSVSDDLARFRPSFEEFEAMAARSRSLHEQLLASASTSHVLASMAAVQRAIDLAPFSDLTTSALRTQFGDWRTIGLSEDWFDRAQRQKLYRVVGLDARLEEVDPEALQTILEVTEVELAEPPPLAPGYAPEALALEPVANEVAAKAAEAYVSLFFLETQLRAFIDRVLRVAVGADWVKQRVHPDIRAEWENRRQQAIRAKGRDDGLTLLAYAHLGDYPAIICQRNNWPFFQPYFRRKESVQESFNRLSPLRIEIGHCRLLTPVDFAYLQVEIHRLWVAIQQSPDDEIDH